MQTMVFTGPLAADPQISPDFAEAVFRLLRNAALTPPARTGSSGSIA